MWSNVDYTIQSDRINKINFLHVFYNFMGNSQCLERSADYQNK